MAGSMYNIHSHGVRSQLIAIEHPRSPDTSDTGHKRAHTANGGAALATYNISLIGGGEQSVITDAQAYTESAGSGNKSLYAQFQCR